MLSTAIDPGPRTSGWVRYDSLKRRVVASCSELPRAEVLRNVIAYYTSILVVEDVAFYGQRVGHEVHATIKLIGAVEDRAYTAGAGVIDRFVTLTRPEVIRHFCGVRNAPKGQVNAALYDRFGGSRKAAVGTKAQPGPLYGMTGHAFDALALAVAYAEGLRPKSDEQEPTIADAAAAPYPEGAELVVEGGERSSEQ